MRMYVCPVCGVKQEVPFACHPCCSPEHLEEYEAARFEEQERRHFYAAAERERLEAAAARERRARRGVGSAVHRYFG